MMSTTKYIHAYTNNTTEDCTLYASLISRHQNAELNICASNLKVYLQDKSSPYTKLLLDNEHVIIFDTHYTHQKIYKNIY